MPQPPEHDTMTLAGLAAANGPWLAMRLLRLAEHSDIPLDRELAEQAVQHASAVLSGLMNAEGRLSFYSDETRDPAVALGREQAQAHMRAKLSMPSSLKLLRLLRRAYDDLVRESWVLKDTRARAHEDVERFFERMLVGLVGAWTGFSAPAPLVLEQDDEVSVRLAQREAELRQAEEVRQRLGLALRQAKEQIAALSAELDSRPAAQDASRAAQDELLAVKGQLTLAQAKLHAQEDLAARLEEARAQLKDQDGLRARLMQAQAQIMDQESMTARLSQAQRLLGEQADLRARLMQAQEQLGEQEHLRAQLSEIKEQAAQSLSGMRAQLNQLKEQAAQSLCGLKAEYANAQAQAQAGVQAETQSLHARIRDLEAERTALGSRLADLEMTLAAHGDLENAQLEAQQQLERARAEADRARDKAERARMELQHIQERAQDLRLQAERDARHSASEAEGLRTELRQLREAHASLLSEAEAMRARLSETGSRVSELRHAEEQEIQAGLTKAADELFRARGRITVLERERAAIGQEAKTRLAELRAERDGLAGRLRDTESQVILLAEESKRQRAELEELRAGGQRAADQARALQAERAEAARRLAEAENKAIHLSGALKAAQDELSALRALEAERAELARRLAEAEGEGLRLTGGLKAAQDELSALRSGSQQAADQARALEAERTELARRLAEAEAQARSQGAELAAAQDELSGLRTGGALAADQARALETERAEAAARLAEAETQAQRLAVELQQAREARTGAELLHQEAERRAAEAVSRTGELLASAKEQAAARMEELSAAREACTRLLNAHLTLTADAVAALDANGGFVAWNKPFPALFGLTDEMLSDGGIAAVQERMAAALQKPEPFLARLRELLAAPPLREDGLSLVTAGGDALVFRSVSAALSANPGGGHGRLLSFRDVSLERGLEDLLREVEGITRYELGQSISAFIHLPQELMDEPGTTPEQTRKLALVREAGYRIVNTVNMAVDIFRMERGLYRMPQNRTLDLAVVARRAVKDAAPLAAGRHVDLELMLDQSPLPQDCALAAPGDPILAHALTLNLLRDALEAAPRQSGVNATLHQDNAELRLDISRQGTVDEAAAYFEKPAPQDPQYGLRRARYAARLIARSLGGTLELFSAVQGGTTLRLRLPKR